MLFYELLYGVTPWNATTQANLASEIKKQPLKFPETPQRSQIVKDTISRMLQAKEENRISWHELFVCPLIQTNEGNLALEIQTIANV